MTKPDETRQGPAPKGQRELAPNQELALVELLAGTSVTDTAAKLGVARQTVSGWRNDPDFDAQFRQRRAEMFATRRHRLLGVIDQATQIVEEALSEEGNLQVALDVLRQSKALGAAFSDESTEITTDASEEADLDEVDRELQEIVEILNERKRKESESSPVPNQ